MAKLILLGIVLFTALLPIWYAKRAAPEKNLRTIQLLTLVAAFFWAVACRNCYTRYVFIE